MLRCGCVCVVQTGTEYNELRGRHHAHGLHSTPFYPPVHTCCPGQPGTPAGSCSGSRPPCDYTTWGLRFHLCGLRVNSKEGLVWYTCEAVEAQPVHTWPWDPTQAMMDRFTHATACGMAATERCRHRGALSHSLVRPIFQEEGIDDEDRVHVLRLSAGLEQRGVVMQAQALQQERAGTPRDHVGRATSGCTPADRDAAVRMAHGHHCMPLRLEGLTFLNQTMLFFCAAIQTQDLLPLLAARRCLQASRTGTRRRQAGNTWDKQNASFPRGEHTPTRSGCSPHVQAQVYSEPAGTQHPIIMVLCNGFPWFTLYACS